MNNAMTYEAFRSFLNFSTFLVNLLTMTAEELALLYSETELSSFAAACRRRDERAYKAFVSCFPGGEAELLATSEDDYTAIDRGYANECAKWGNLAMHITDAIMVVRQNQRAACERMMAL